MVVKHNKQLMPVPAAEFSTSTGFAGARGLAGRYAEWFPLDALL